MAANGSLIIFGFFALINGNRVTSTTSRRDGTTRTTSHIVYDTTLQGLRQTYLPIQCRAWSPRDDNPLPDNTVVFLVARACTTPALPILPLLDVILMCPVPGSPPSDLELETSTYCDGLPAGLDYPFVFGVGTVVTNTQNVPDGVRPDGQPATVRIFTVQVSEHIVASRRVSRLECVFGWERGRWDNTPSPALHSTVAFFGICRHVGQNSILGVSLENITLNVAPAAGPPLGPGGPGNDNDGSPSPGKKRRFNAKIPPSSLTTIGQQDSSQAVVAGPSSSGAVASSPSAMSLIMSSPSPVRRPGVQLASESASDNQPAPHSMLGPPFTQPAHSGRARTSSSSSLSEPDVNIGSSGVQQPSRQLRKSSRKGKERMS